MQNYQATQLSTSTATRAIRLTHAFSHVLLGVLITATIVPFCSKRFKNTLVQWWSQALLNCFNIQLVSHNPPPQNMRQTLCVSNHISWVDIFAINAVFPIRFIAKSEVNHWPILGYLVRKSGTLFINRSAKKDALRVVSEAASAMQQGENFCFFPEGTTTDGTQLLTFKNSVLQAAIDAKAVILPIAIRYPTHDNRANIAMAYAGDSSLWDSVKAIVRQTSPSVEVCFLQAIDLKTWPEANRHAVSQLAHQTIQQQLNFSA